MSEHVYCVVVAFKMTEQVEQWICIQFCIKLDHSFKKPFECFRRPQLWESGDCWQLHQAMYHVSCRDFLVKHEITLVTQPHYSPDLAPCDFWLFPKLRSSLKGKKFQTLDEIQENMMRQLMAIERTVWGSKVPPLKGTEASLSCVQCFLYLISSSVNVPVFHIMCWILSGQASYVCYEKV